MTPEVEPTKDELRPLVVEGLSNREIGVRFGMTSHQIAKRLTRFGIRRSRTQFQRLRARASVNREKTGARVPRSGRRANEG